MAADGGTSGGNATLHTSGTYLFQNNPIDLGGVYSIELDTTLKARAFFPYADFVDTWADWDAIASVDGTTPSGGDVKLYVRTTQEASPSNSDWTSWRVYNNAQISCRKYELKAEFTTAGNLEQIAVSQLRAQPLMGRRTESGSATASNSGDQTVAGNYPVPNSTGANVRADINENLDDLYSTSSGSTPPAAAGSATGQLWIDTSTTPDTLKVKTGSGTTSANYTTLGEIATNFGHASLASPTFTGNIGFPAGSNSSLPIRNAADTDTGIYWGGTNELDIRAGDTDAHTFTASASEPKLPLRGTNGTETAPSLSFSSDTNLGLYRSAADTLSITAGGDERAYFDSSGLNIKDQLDLRLYDSNSSNYAAIQAPSNISSNYTLTLPADDGASGSILESNGSGVLSWATSANKADQLTTAREINGVSFNGTGNITIPIQASGGGSESTAPQIFGGRLRAWARWYTGGSTPGNIDSYAVSSITEVTGSTWQVNFDNSVFSPSSIHYGAMTGADIETNNWAHTRTTASVRVGAGGDGSFGLSLLILSTDQ